MEMAKVFDYSKSYICNTALFDELHSERFYRVIPFILLPILFVLLLMAGDIEQGYTVITNESEVRKALETQQSTVTESGIQSHLEENPLFTSTNSEQSTK